MDKAALRDEFRDIARDKQLDIQYKERTAQLESLQKSMIESMKVLISFLDKKTTKTEVVNQLNEIGTPDALKVVSAVQKLEETINGKQIDLKPVIEALNSLKRETTLIPSKIKVEKTEQVKVSNLSEVKFDTKDLEKAIKGLDLKVDAPIINTEKVDLKPLKDVMLDLLKAFNKQELKVPDTFKISNLDEIKATDLKEVEKKLDESNKHLKKLVEKPVGSGGGGGNGTPYVDATGKPVNIVKGFDPGAAITTDWSTPSVIIETDGIRTKTTTIANGVATEVWS
jgi:hypothetical protein